MLSIMCKMLCTDFYRYNCYLLHHHHQYNNYCSSSACWCSPFLIITTTIFPLQMCYITVSPTAKTTTLLLLSNKSIITTTTRQFPTRIVYLYYISCLRYTILVGNPQTGTATSPTTTIATILLLVYWSYCLAMPFGIEMQTIAQKFGASPRTKNWQ